MPKPLLGSGHRCQQCDQPVHARKLCEKHYRGWHRRQTKCEVCGALAVRNTGARRGTKIPVCRECEPVSLEWTFSRGKYRQITPQAREVMLSKWASQIKPEGECWVWTGNQNEGEYGAVYGQYRHGKRINHLAHRFGYLFFIGGHANNQQLDHLCNESLCVRPDHLLPLTAKQNIHLRDRRSGIRGDSNATGTDLGPIPLKLMAWTMRWNKQVKEAGEGFELPLGKSTDTVELPEWEAAAAGRYRRINRAVTADWDNLARLQQPNASQPVTKKSC